MGDIRNYLARIYGPDFIDDPSDTLEGEVFVYDIRQTYDILWDEFSPSVVDLPLGPHSVDAITRQYDLVISTIPANALCVDPSHKFIASYIWVAGETTDGGVKFNWGIDNNKIIRNGATDAGTWTRASKTFNVMTVEWPDGDEAPMPTAARVPKPVTNTCDCWPEVVRLGRFGRWDRNALVHHAFDETIGAINHRRNKV